MYAGLLSYPETCAKLPNPSNAHLKGENQPLRRVGDPSHRYGSYAYRLPDEAGNYGYWIGYEDPEFAQHKADYAVRKGLGGVAIHDLTYDDVRFIIVHHYSLIPVIDSFYLFAGAGRLYWR